MSPKDNDGCLYGDGDGVLDSADRCLDVKGHIDTQGCPIGDMDGDGVKDADDNCPNTFGRAEAYPYLDKLAEFLVKQRKYKKP